MRTWITALMIGLMTPVLALAEVAPVPDGDIFSLVMQLISNGKAMGTAAIGIVVTMLATQLVKNLMPDTNMYKRLIVLVLSCAYGIFLAVVGGATWPLAALAILINSGGAMALYEALKGAGVFKSGTST